MIAGHDGPWARLIRGLVEAGLPDHTRMVVAAPVDGALSTEELLRFDPGGAAVTLRFGSGAPLDEEYVYTLRVAVDRVGVSVLARCPETLFHHVWAGTPLEALAPRLLADLRAHTRAFVDWRLQGGEPGYAERLAIGDGPATPPDAGFVRFLDDLYRSGHRLDEGPARGWWGGGPAAGPTAITTGMGIDRVYHLGGPVEDPEVAAWRGRFATAGRLWYALLAVQGLAALGTFSWTAWTWWKVGAPPWGGVASLLAAGLAMGLYGVLGQALVHPRERWVQRHSVAARWTLVALAVLAGLPCTGVCCVAGLPLAGWTIRLLADDRAVKVL